MGQVLNCISKTSNNKVFNSSSEYNIKPSYNNKLEQFSQQLPVIDTSCSSVFESIHDSVRSLVRVENINTIYTLGKVVGKGSSGEVRQAFHTKTKVECAIKIIKKINILRSDIIIEQMTNELKVLEVVSHPSIVRVFQLLHDDNKFYIVTEFAKYETLYHHLNWRMREKKGPLTEQQVHFIMCQLFSSLEYLHSKYIVHRDVKLENILINKIDENGQIHIKLTDFGLSQFLNETQSTRRLGSLHYMAPEIINREWSDYKVDVWAASVVIFALFFSLMPYNGKVFKDFTKQIQSNHFDEFIRRTNRLSLEAKKFIKCGLTQDQNQRYDSHQMLQHNWIKTYSMPAYLRNVPFKAKDSMPEDLNEDQIKTLIQTMLKKESQEVPTSRASLLKSMSQGQIL